MIENRLCLNKKTRLPKYEIDGLLVREYRKGVQVPDFIPDVSLCSWGDISVCEPCTRTKETWFKGCSEELKIFLKTYDWNSIKTYKHSANSIPVYLFKKIILEEFYGVKDGE